VEPRRIFVDTGAWFAVQARDDEWHGRAVGTLRALLAGPCALVTTNHVVGETYTLLRVVSGHGAAVRFLDYLEESRRLERIFVDQETEGRALRLLRQHADQDFSFVDATSFAVMRAEKVRHAFAFDRHFSTAGFLRVPGDVPVEQV
jgi:predicted nucleic acid-binding protein